MRIFTLLWGLIILAGCRHRPSQETLGASNRPAALDPVCLGALAWFQAAITPSDSGQVTAADTTLVPPLGEQPIAACQVRVWLPHGMREGQPPYSVSDDSVPAALQRSGGEWHRLIQYDADGPDGSLSGYQRGQERCTVARSWDGGDDSDSTYVAEEWYRQELTCWVEPGPGA
jgi:hypothetical protein